MSETDATLETRVHSLETALNNLALALIHLLTTLRQQTTTGPALAHAEAALAKAGFKL